MFDMAEEIAALRRHYQNQQGDRALGALEALQRLSDAISGFSIGEQTLTQQSNCKTNRKRGQPDESGRTWED